MALDFQGCLVDVNVEALLLELCDVWGAADAGLVEHLLPVGCELADEADALAGSDSPEERIAAVEVHPDPVVG